MNAHYVIRTQPREHKQSTSFAEDCWHRSSPFSDANLLGNWNFGPVDFELQVAVCRCVSSPHLQEPIERLEEGAASRSEGADVVGVRMVSSNFIGRRVFLVPSPTWHVDPPAHVPPHLLVQRTVGIARALVRALDLPRSDARGPVGLG